MKMRILVSGLLGALVIIAAAGCSSQPIPVKPTPTAVAGGKTVQNGGERIVAGGKVVPVKSAELSFPVAGSVAKIPISVGDRVQAGQLLAQLDDSVAQKQIAQAQSQLEIAHKQEGEASAQVQLAEKQLALAKAGGTDAEVASARAALSAASANYEKVKRGPSADALAQLKAAMDSAKAAVDQAQAAYDRAGGSSNPYIGLTPQSLQLQQATNAYQAALAAFNDARSQPTADELAAAGAQVQQAQAALAQLSPGQAALDVAQAQVDSARAAESLAQAQVDSAQAAVDTASAQAANYRLLAPFAGTVMTVDIDAGEYALPGTEVVRLADTSAWQIETTDLTELNIVSVAEGTPVTMTFDAIPGLELAGKVTRIRPYGDTKQGDIVYTVTIAPDKQDARLQWNMTAKVSIEGK